MKDYKYVIVGAGLSGLTIAERIANELDEEVLIIEKRNHIAGNCYDFYKDNEEDKIYKINSEIHKIKYQSNKKIKINDQINNSLMENVNKK